MATDEGKESTKSGCFGKSSSNPYENVQTGFHWQGGKCKKEQYIGRVTIGTNFVIEFTLSVHDKSSDSWESILHIGHSDGERSPGLWFHPKTYQLHVRLSDVKNANTGYDPNTHLEKNGKYDIKFECIDNTVTLYIDGTKKVSMSDVVHVTRFLAPIWAGDPWYDVANATIENLNIYDPLLISNDNDLVAVTRKGIINVLAIDHAHGIKENGKYFHFDKNEIDSYLQRPLKNNERFEICVKRTNYVGSVIMWPTNNGGSKGNAHGRFDKDPIGDGIGYFKVGDQIEIRAQL